MVAITPRQSSLQLSLAAVHHSQSFYSLSGSHSVCKQKFSIGFFFNDDDGQKIENAGQRKVGRLQFLITRVHSFTYTSVVPLLTPRNSSLEFICRQIVFQGLR
jgi:hypothetical protein